MRFVFIYQLTVVISYFMKVVTWVIAVLCGMLVGKVLIHGLLCKRIIRLKMFRDEQVIDYVIHKCTPTREYLLTTIVALTLVVTFFPLSFSSPGVMDVHVPDGDSVYVHVLTCV